MKKTWPSPDMKEFYLVADDDHYSANLNDADKDFLSGKVSDYFPDLSEDEG